MKQSELRKLIREEIANIKKGDQAGSGAKVGKVKENPDNQFIKTIEKEIDDTIKQGPKAIVQLFDRYEDDNYHTENALLLAKAFGDENDYKIAKAIFRRHEKEGFLNGNVGKVRRELYARLLPKFKEVEDSID